MTSKTKIYQRGIWPEMHSIISQHTVITLTQERRADIPTTKGIIGLVPSRIGPVPTIRLAECKVKVLKAQWRHPVFCFMQNTSSSWLVQLLIDGQVVLEETPKSCIDKMTEKTWNIATYLGKNAQFRLVDKSSAFWGHINFDNLRQCQRMLIR